MTPLTTSELRRLKKAHTEFQHAKLGHTLALAIEFERRKKDSYLIKVDNKPLK